MKVWEPTIYEGTMYQDPRKELLARTYRAQRANDMYVAVPVELALACGAFRECDATKVITNDEDGPLGESQEIRCTKQAGHPYMHFNGYTHWEG